MAEPAPRTPPPLPPEVFRRPPPPGGRSWAVQAAIWGLTAFLVQGLVLGVAFGIFEPDGVRPGLSPLARIMLAFLAQDGAGLLIVLGVCFAFVPPGRRFSALGLRRPASTLTLASFLAYWGAIYSCALLLNLIGMSIFKSLGLPTSKPLVLLFAPDGRLTPAAWTVLGLSVVLLAPITEELLFRLALYEALRPIAPRPAVLTAAIFAGFHFEPDLFLGLFVVGYGLQKLRDRAGGSLLPCICLHALINLTAFLFMLFGGK